MSERFSSRLLRGSVHTIHVANPAAAADWTDATPVNMYTEIQTIRFTFVTSAAVVNRNVTIQISDAAGNSLYRVNAPFQQTAGQTRHYYCSQHGAPNTVIYPLSLQIPLPQGLVLGQGFFYGSQVEGPMDAADQLSDIYVCVLRCAYH